MFATALDEGEIVTEVRFPIPEKAHLRKVQSNLLRASIIRLFCGQVLRTAVRVAVTGARRKEGVFRLVQVGRNRAKAAISIQTAEALSGVSVSWRGMIRDLPTQRRLTARIWFAVHDQARCRRLVNHSNIHQRWEFASPWENLGRFFATNMNCCLPA